jgi:hypothetical protein
MRNRRSRPDEILYLAAFSTVLVGLALLLHTTGLARSFTYLVPLLVIAGGGLLLFFAILRGGSIRVFLVGLFLAIGGSILLVGVLAAWPFGAAWPLMLTTAGASWLLAGLRDRHRLKASFAAPSIAFILLGLFLSLFSFRLVGISFGGFMRDWWPSLIIAGGFALFGAYGASRRRNRRPEP